MYNKKAVPAEEIEARDVTAPADDGGDDPLTAGMTQEERQNYYRNAAYEQQQELIKKSDISQGQGLSVSGYFNLQAHNVREALRGPLTEDEKLRKQHNASGMFIYQMQILEEQNRQYQNQIDAYNRLLNEYGKRLDMLDEMIELARKGELDPALHAQMFEETGTSPEYVEKYGQDYLEHVRQETRQKAKEVEERKDEFIRDWEEMNENNDLSEDEKLQLRGERQEIEWQRLEKEDHAFKRRLEMSEDAPLALKKQMMEATQDQLRGDFDFDTDLLSEFNQQGQKIEKSPTIESPDPARPLGMDIG